MIIYLIKQLFDTFSLFNQHSLLFFSTVKHYIFKIMNLGLLFLKANTLGVITLSELDWITDNQPNFSRLDMALVIKIGRLMDSGIIEIDCRLPV